MVTKTLYVRQQKRHRCKELNLIVIPPYGQCQAFFGRQYKIAPSIRFSSVQSLSCVWLFATPWTTHARTPCPSPTWSLLKFMSIELVMPSNNLILCRPLLLPPSVFSNIRVFSNESVLHIRRQKYWSFSFNIGPSNGHSGLISIRIDWLDVLAVQGLSRVFSNAIVRKHQFLDAQLSFFLSFFFFLEAQLSL